jgi:hypothetical protein
MHALHSAIRAALTILPVYNVNLLHSVTLLVTLCANAMMHLSLYATNTVHIRAE